MLIRRFALLALTLATALFSQVESDRDTGWRISPEKINVQVDDERRLQLLDDSAQELSGAEWSVDNPALAEIREEGAQIIVHTKAAGTVTVSAFRGGEKRSRKITIWPSSPEGTTGWGMHPIGRDIGDLAAVPTPDGPNVFSLEQTASASTYLRGVTTDGMQAWAWLMPEKTQNVDLVCGDWLGGALISANRGTSYTLYNVAGNGRLRWQHTFNGARKAHAYNLDHLLHVLSQSADGTRTTITGIDGTTGAVKFELVLPVSHAKQVNVKRPGTKVICAARAASALLRSIPSRLFVNIDGFAYVAFTQNEWTLESPACTPGEVIPPANVIFTRDEKLILWQVHPDGSYRSTIVEESKQKQSLAAPVSAGSPTGAIIPDGLGGVLLSVRWSHSDIVPDVHGLPDELIYRIQENGEVAYQFPLPQYDGPLKDEMVLGENDRGFATRGSVLIAFNVPDGKELWRWDAHTTGIEVFAALANGGCLVQTPEALVQVNNATESAEVFKGKAMMDWQGQLYRKSN